jgi:hypothetical protein
LTVERPGMAAAWRKLAHMLLGEISQVPKSILCHLCECPEPTWTEAEWRLGAS